MKEHKKNTITWIIITNSTKALLYQVENKKANLIKELEHPASRLKSIDLTSDKSGSFKTNHTTRGQFASSANSHEDEHENFSREINELLESNRQKNNYQHLTLCAEPHFLGLLNKHMNPNVQALLKKIIEKDYIPLPKHKLDSVIQNIIQEINA